MAKQVTMATAKQGSRRAPHGAKDIAPPATEKKKPAPGAKLRTGASKMRMIAPVGIYRATPQERVKMIHAGVPATSVEEIVHNMAIPKVRLYTTLGLPRSTMDSNIRKKATLSVAHSERVIGLERLIGQVAVMVEQSGNSEGFDAYQWLGIWLERPLPALGGEKPANFMDTMEGQDLVSKLLARSQSGAYA